MDIIEKAKQFAQEKHANQKRKDGKPYFSHLEGVAKHLEGTFVSTDEAIAAAYLHDVMEDQGVSWSELEEKFGPVVAGYVDALTRKPEETYFDFTVKIAKHFDPMVKRLKLSDLGHNMSDLKEGSLKDKYRFAFQMIYDSLQDGYREWN